MSRTYTNNQIMYFVFLTTKSIYNNKSFDIVS